ncbi:uncharacterized protein BYT42DRAFT_618169 [Radiomyces spectabilis]|uniref:uncharacterized protein n=1 Tax=Radiomyces spectabilis TaxID=64574 RepID=UPI0022208A6A|nr:uncharacterized protein BYT42DRAFT_618169 [Radiomyces spectabilis]KAI8366664.1 hypothetical protein BYT42DRAFT_618169 [Radiomyces spectabilis]
MEWSLSTSLGTELLSTARAMDRSVIGGTCRELDATLTTSVGSSMGVMLRLSSDLVRINLDFRLSEYRRPASAYSIALLCLGNFRKLGSHRITDHHRISDVIFFCLVMLVIDFLDNTVEVLYDRVVTPLDTDDA